MKKSVQFLFVLLTCLQLCGGSHGLMQCVAWAGMLAKFTQSDGVAEAVVKTFDGEHPCALCLAIEEAKKNGPQTPPTDRTPEINPLKLCREMPLCATLEIPDVPVVENPFLQAIEPAVLCIRLAHAPPVPPPRV